LPPDTRPALRWGKGGSPLTNPSHMPEGKRKKKRGLFTVPVADKTEKKKEEKKKKGGGTEKDRERW